MHIFCVSDGSTMMDWEMEAYRRMEGRVSEAETKHLSAKKFVPYLLHLMNHKRIFRRNGIYLKLHFKSLNLVKERCRTWLGRLYYIICYFNEHITSLGLSILFSKILVCVNPFNSINGVWLRITYLMTLVLFFGGQH